MNCILLIYKDKSKTKSKLKVFLKNISKMKYKTKTVLNTLYTAFN